MCICQYHCQCDKSDVTVKMNFHLKQALKYISKPVFPKIRRVLLVHHIFILCFMVYNPSKDKFVTLNGLILRSALAHSLPLPLDWSGDTVEAYFAPRGLASIALVINAV